MGKISDALERHNRENTLKVEALPLKREESQEPERRESTTIEVMKVRPETNQKVVILSAPDSIDAEYFRLLRAQLLFPKEGKAPRTIMITSSFPAEGKSYVAANLAASIALGVNEHVLLVDCDLRMPSQHRMFGCPANHGLTDYLSRGRALSELIVGTGVDKLSLLSAGSSRPNPTELLSSQAMKAFLEEVAQRYDDRYIVIDSSPSRVTAEANIMANFVDGIVFVVMAGKAPRDAVKKSIETLGKDKILGIVFNGYNQPTKGYYKYYEEYYGGKG